MAELRNNHDLDDAFLNPTDPAKAKRRRKKQAGARDAIRRRAFKVLALISDLNAGDRAKVLKAAERLNKA